MHKRRVLCFGNELHGDDGFGIRVFQSLRLQTWPADVELCNAGIAGLDALGLLRDCRQAILVDALAGRGNIGQICILRPEDLSVRQQSPTGHGLGLAYLLEALKIFRAPLPEILIVGVEVAGVQAFCLGLSAAAEGAVPEAVRVIRELLSE